MKKIVLYDGKCGLCKREINFYRKISPANKFEWVDVTRVEFKKYNLNLVDMLKRLHVIHNKKIYIGLDAFIEIWSELKYFKLLAFVASLPLVRSLLSWCYEKFANYRFNQLNHCQILERK